GNGTLEQHQALVGVDRVDGEVLNGLAGVTHATGHLDALEHTRRRGSGTNGAGLAVVAVCTVRGANTLEAVALHHTSRALALGSTGDVNQLAGLKGVGCNLLAERELGGVCSAHLSNVAARRHTGGLEVTLEGVGDAAWVDGAE